jgi:hypothetical protein
MHGGDRDSVFVRVAHYELDGPGIDSWGVRFSVPSRTAPRSTQSPAHLAWIFPIRKETGAWW